MKVASVVRALRCSGLHSKPGAHVSPEILIAVIAQCFDKAGERQLRNAAVLGKAAGGFIDDLIRIFQNGLIDDQIIRGEIGAVHFHELKRIHKDISLIFTAAVSNI